MGKTITLNYSDWDENIPLNPVIYQQEQKMLFWIDFSRQLISRQFLTEL